MVRDPSSRIWFLDLARVEFFSALFRRFRSGAISDGDLNVAVSGFEEQCLNFSVEALSSALVSESERLLREYGKSNGLRTLDALHLAGFSVIAEADWNFVTADSNQADVCRLLGWRVINPIADIKEPTA